MNINIPFWKFVFDLIQTMFTVGIAIYVWIVAKHKANASRINALEDKTTADIHEVTQRLTVIETKVEQMPDRTAIGNIHAASTSRRRPYTNWRARWQASTTTAASSSTHCLKERRDHDAGHPAQL